MPPKCRSAERAAQDGDAIGAGRAFFRQKRPAGDRVGAEDREQIRRRADARHVERLAAAGKRVAQLTERRHAWHGARLLPSSPR